MKTKCFSRGFAVFLCLALLLPLCVPTTRAASDVVPVVVGNTKGYVSRADVAAALKKAGNPAKYAVTFAPGAKTVGRFAFNFQKGLVSVTLADSITFIEGDDGELYRGRGEDFRIRGAFYQCTALQTVQWSKNLQLINPNAFYGCSSLKSAVLPPKLQAIGKSAFEFCTDLNVVILPQGVARIGKFSFRACSSIQKIDIPDSVNRIEAGAFSDCKSLQTATIGANILNGGGVCGGVFQGCEKLKTARFRSSVKQIGTSVFQDCPNLKTIRFDGNMPAPFAGFSNLTTTVRVPTGDQTWDVYERIKNNGVAAVKRRTPKSIRNESPTYVKKIAISGKKTFDSRCVDREIVLNTLKKNGNPKFYNIVVRKGVKIISENAFARQPGLVGVTLPDSVKLIDGPGEYYDFGNEIDKPEKPGVPDSAIEGGAFEGCVNLTSIKLPKNLEEIGARAFAGCVRLEEVEIPKGMIRIGEYAFANCVRIKKLDLSKMRLGQENNFFPLYEGAFSGCSNLHSFVLPKEIAHLPPKMFYGCIKLEKLTIPQALGDIGEDAFTGVPVVTFEGNFRKKMRKWYMGNVGVFGFDKSMFGTPCRVTLPKGNASWNAFRKKPYKNAVIV